MGVCVPCVKGALVTSSVKNPAAYMRRHSVQRRFIGPFFRNSMTGSKKALTTNRD